MVHFIKCGKKTDPLGPINIYGTDIEHVKHWRFLGVTIDNKLKWGPHIDENHKHAQRMSNAIRKLTARKFGPTARKGLTLYKSLVLSRLRYAGHVLLNAARSETHKLETLQNRIVKKMIGVPKLCSDSAALAEANCPPLKFIWEEEILNSFNRVLFLSNNIPF